MTCSWVQKRLTAYIDGELDVAERRVLKTHLGLCSACSVEYDRLKKAAAAMRAWAARPLPEGFVDAVQQRVERGDTARRIHVPAIDVRALLGVLPQWSWQAAAACVLLFVGMLFGHLVWTQSVERGIEGAVRQPPYTNGVREEAVKTLATLQKLKIILGMREGNARAIADLSAMQGELAHALGPGLAGRVALYHEAEALIAAGRFDDANAILTDLGRERTFPLAPYARITWLAAQPAPEEPRGRSVDLLLAEVLASPERLYEVVAARSRRLLELYAEMIENELGPFMQLRSTPSGPSPRVD